MLLKSKEMFDLELMEGDNFFFDFVVVFGVNFIMGIIFLDVSVGLDGLVVVVIGSFIVG